MPRKKRSASPFELMDDDFDEDASSQGSRCDNPPIQRNAANARERARMRVLSSAFGRLKTKLPNIPSDTKLSKLDTLRLATMYIKQLKAVVEGTAPLSTNAAMGADHDNDGALNDTTTPSCYLQLHSGAQSMNWPFGLHHQVNHHSSARSQTTSSAASNVNTTSTSWCQTEVGNPSKYSRYETDNYHQEHHEELPTPASLGHHHQDNPSSYLLTLSSSLPSTALLTTPPNPTQQQETVWYSETPSPDLSNSSSGGGLGGGYDSSHTTPQQQRHNNLMEHLSHMQLTPPPSHSSSASRQFQQQQHQHQHLLHHHHNHPHQSNHNQQYSNQLQHQLESNHHPHHHHHLSTPALHHQNFANSQSLTSASIR